MDISGTRLVRINKYINAYRYSSFLIGLKLHQCGECNKISSLSFSQKSRLNKNQHTSCNRPFDLFFFFLVSLFVCLFLVYLFFWKYTWTITINTVHNEFFATELLSLLPCCKTPTSISELVKLHKILLNMPNCIDNSIWWIEKNSFKC